MREKKKMTFKDKERRRKPDATKTQLWTKAKIERRIAPHTIILTTAPHTIILTRAPHTLILTTNAASYLFDLDQMLVRVAQFQDNLILRILCGRGLRGKLERVDDIPIFVSQFKLVNSNGSTE
jgi:hypothetical protein